MVGGWESTADFIKKWFASAIFLAVVVFVIVRVARLNLLGYFLIFAIATLLTGCVELLSQPNGFYHVQGMVSIAALVILLIWPLSAWLSAKDAAVRGETVPEVR